MSSPGIAAGTGPYTPTPPSGWQALLGYNLNVTLSCQVDVVSAFKQSFSGGQIGWACQLLIDGVVIHDCWGQATIDSVTLMGSAFLAAGNHTVVVLWQSASSVTVYRPRMKINWSFK